jgi:hypothetical protein
VLANYTVEYSQDTFDICKELSGLETEVPLEDLLKVFRLPPDLPHRKHVNLVQFISMMQDVQPEAQVVFAPMLFGEADLSGVLATGLPKLVHFTVKDKNRLKPHQVVSMASWARFNPGHSILLFDDHDVRLFMNTYFRRLLPTFDTLESQVERTDMWRYLVLCIFGGVYADSDVVAARPLKDWVQDAGLLVGIENVFTTPEAARKRTYARQVQMVQWVIAAKRGHPVVCRMGDYVRAHVAKEASGEFFDPDRNHAILERTGPGIWSSSVHDYILEHGYNVTDVVAGVKVGDMRVLPQPVFGCPSSQFNPWFDPVPYVYHMFKGSWRKAPPSKLSLLVVTLWHLAVDTAYAYHPPAHEVRATEAARHAAALAAARRANATLASASSSSRKGQEPSHIQPGTSSSSSSSAGALAGGAAAATPAAHASSAAAGAAGAVGRQQQQPPTTAAAAAAAAAAAVAAQRHYPPMPWWFPCLVFACFSGVLLALVAGVARSGCCCWAASKLAAQPAVAAALARGKQDAATALVLARVYVVPAALRAGQAAAVALSGALRAAAAAASMHPPRDLRVPFMVGDVCSVSDQERHQGSPVGCGLLADAGAAEEGVPHGALVGASGQGGISHSSSSSSSSRGKRAAAGLPYYSGLQQR